MRDNLQITTEAVDDIPVLLAQGQKIGVAELLDEHFQPHGNWRGTGFGQTTLVWLAHILSEGDHRLNQVEAWVEQRLHLLGRSLGQPVRSPEWSDDRLGIVLDELADPEKWTAFESALNRQTIRVYDLKPRRVRLDSTTASGYWTVTDAGLFQFGHSKDHRPDLPQLKVMLSALDPMGLPLATQVLSGERADDQLYIPAIQQVRHSLEEPGLLYVGDCKMAALATRAFIQHHQDYYLCPLSEKQLPLKTLETYLQPVWSGQQAVSPITRPNPAGEVESLAEGYERALTMRAEIDGQVITWTERHLIVHSFQHARASEATLRTRLAKAQAELQQLNERKRGKPLLTDMTSWQAAVDQVLQHYHVAGLLTVRLIEQTAEHAIRGYGDRPARTELGRTFTVESDQVEAAVQEAVRWFGWRVYATNHTQAPLPLEKAVLAYREEYLVERGFGRLKGKPLSLSPMYVQSDERATGLVRLLSIGLRLLTVIEHRVRQRLADQAEKLPGLYAGNPARTTARPTAEALLHAFKGIYLSVVTLGEQMLYHVTPLSDAQVKILDLLDFSADIYTQLVVSGFLKPAPKMAEP